MVAFAPLKRIVSGIILASLVAASPCARAAPKGERPAEPKPDPKTIEAGRLKASADALMDDHRYADALALYLRAYELSGDPALLYNQGRALEAMGDYAEALEKLGRFEADAPIELRKRVPGLRDLIQDLESRMATIVVKTNVRGARLVVRQKTMGEIQGERNVKLRAGATPIEVTADGYEPFHRDVDVSAGATITIEANLIPKTRDATVHVTTRPLADILIDGKAFGRSPLDARVPIGTHELLVRADGYEEQSVAWSVAVGERRDFDLDLKKTPSILGKWWFWTGLGVLVAGGVATAIVLTTEKSPPSGTLGKVPGP